MTQAPPAREIATSREWELLDDRIVEAYLASAVEILQSASTRGVTLVHTALHGVSTEVFVAALTRAGFPAPIEVTDQRDPDPDFPTLDFPNPEEEGALDRLEGFASLHGPARYGLAPNDETITLVKERQPVAYPARIDTGEGPVTVFDPGHPLYWRVA